MTAAVLLLSALQLATHPADESYEEALRLLQSGKPAEAEQRAREALARSLPFAPQEEIEVRPDKGLLFDEMILAARTSYRERRGRYFRALGDTLSAQELWAASRKAYRRAMELAPSPEIPVLMADDADLDTAARVDLLLAAYLAPGADRPRLETMLLETGAFLNRNALKASLDRRRFPRLLEGHPDLELLEGAFPEFQAVTDAGTLIPSQLFRSGATLVVYSPTDACARCSEELDGLTAPVRDALKRGTPIQAAAFVSDADLPVVRRIVRLLGMAVGVGRRDGLPAGASFLETGEIRFVARSGMTQIRFPTSEALGSGEIRRRAEAVLAFLGEPGLPTEDRPEEAVEPLVTLETGTNEVRTFHRWVEQLERLEAGPAPLTELYAELNRHALRIVSGQGRSLGYELLEALSRLRGANGAKVRALGLAGERLGEQLLEKAKTVDPSILRTPQGEQGVLHVAVSEEQGEPRRLYLQRSFVTDEGLRNFDFVLEEAGPSLEIRWAAAHERRPLGVAAVSEGAVFTFACEPPEPPASACRGLRLVSGGEVLFEGEPAGVVAGEVVAIRSALVDEVADRGPVPRFHVRVSSHELSALEKGLALFAAADFAGAATLFVQASEEIDPVAPYDASELVYNRARALEEQGKRREALELYRSLGDVAYQSLVDERARLIESGR